MAVDAILNKVIESYPDVIGAIAQHDDQIYHNLQAPYDIVSAGSIMQSFTEMFAQTAVMADEGYDFEELILDFDSHSFIIRRIEGGLMVILTPQLQRAQLIKLRVALGLFTKSVTRELGAGPDSGPSTTLPAIVEPAAADPVATEAEEGVIEGTKTPRGRLQAGLGFVGKRLGRALTSATQEAMAVDVDALKKDSQANVPLGPDGKPKKARMYRGVAFYD